jgi:hypothetical protein
MSDSRSRLWKSDHPQLARLGSLTCRLHHLEITRHLKDHLSHLIATHLYLTLLRVPILCTNASCTYSIRYSLLIFAHRSIVQHPTFRPPSVNSKFDCVFQPSIITDPISQNGSEQQLSVLRAPSSRPCPHTLERASTSYSTFIIPIPLPYAISLCTTATIPRNAWSPTRHAPSP